MHWCRLTGRQGIGRDVPFKLAELVESFAWGLVGLFVAVAGHAGFQHTYVDVRLDNVAYLSYPVPNEIKSSASYKT